MTAVLRIVQGPHAGKALPLQRAKALTFEVRSPAGGGGRISFGSEAAGWVFVNASPLRALHNGQPVQRAVLDDGDRIAVGRFIFEAQLAGVRTSLPDMGKAETAAYSAPPGGDARTARRISASNIAAVDVPAESRPGLLGRMTQMLRRRDPQRDELARMREERDGLLRASGRQALECLGGIGLPADTLARLGRGEQVVLQQNDLDAGALEGFRRARERLGYLDTAIAALRNGDEGTAAIEELPAALASEHRQAEERAFSASDGLLTEALPEAEAAALVQDPAQSRGGSGPGPGQSARRRTRRRR